MKRSRTMLSSLLIICLFLFGGVLAIAQDETPEPDAPPVETTPVPAPVSSSGIVLTTLEVVLGVIGIFAAGGIVGIAGAGTVAYRLRTNPATIAAIEKLGDSVPEATATQIMNLTGQFQSSVDQWSQLLKEALDRMPAASKPPTYTAP